MGTLPARMSQNTNDLMCSYAALLLADAGEEVTAANITTVTKAAGGSVPAYYAQIFEKVAGMNSVADMIKNAGKVGGGGGGGAPAAGGAAPAAAAAKVSSSEDEEAAPAASIFGDDGGGDY